MNMPMVCGAKCHESIYLSGKRINGLFKFDCDEQKLYYIAPFIKEKPNYAIYNNAFKIRNEVWFIPQHGKFVCVVDLSDYHMDFFMLPYKKIWKFKLDGKESISYFGGVVDNKFIFILPATVDAAFWIDTDSREIVAIYDVIRRGEWIEAGIYAEGVVHAFTGDGKWHIFIDFFHGYAHREKWNGDKINGISYLKERKQYIYSAFGKSSLSILDAGFNDCGDIKFGGGLHKNIYIAPINRMERYLLALPWGGKEFCLIDKFTLELQWVNLRDCLQRSIAKHLTIARSCKFDIDLNDEFHLAQIESSDDCICVSYEEGVLLFFDEKSSEWNLQKLDLDIMDIQRSLVKFGVGVSDILFNEEGIIYEKELFVSDYIKLIIGITAKRKAI